MKFRVLFLSLSAATILAVGGLLWMKSVFTTSDMRRVIRDDPKSYRELASLYNKELWMNRLPSEMEVRSAPLRYLSKYNGWLAGDSSLVVKDGNRRAVFSLNLFPAKCHFDTMACSPDVFLFDEDMNIVAWRISSF